MYRKSGYLALFLLLSGPTYLKSAPIKLESGIIAKIDGLAIGIDGQTIALIKQYQSEIIAILLGKKSGDMRIGKYEFDGKKRSLQELRQLETELGTSPKFVALRGQARNDFEKISEPFRKIVQGVKSFMSILIEESCKKRGRLDSLLYTWAKTDEKNEYELFDLHVKSIKDFELFLTDLNNFLGDLVHSCPRALGQFQERVAKFNQAMKFVAVMNVTGDKRQKLLKLINSSLDKMSKEEVTQAKIQELANRI